jgi:hypothetical protein
MALFYAVVVAIFGDRNYLQKGFAVVDFGGAKTAVTPKKRCRKQITVAGNIFKGKADGEIKGRKNN